MLRANFLKDKKRVDLNKEQLEKEDEAAHHMTHIMKQMHNYQRFKAPFTKVGS